MHKMSENIIYTIGNNNPNPEFIFSFGSDDWFMKVKKTENGPVMEFNVKKYPDMLPSDFANKFAELLSTCGYLNSFFIEKNNEST
jgi:hypothetical protein